MAYRQDIKSAASRHLKAAQALYENGSPGAQPGCRAVAGYIFGLAGELAIKEMMHDSGMRPLSADQRRDDPFYAHFPALKTHLTRLAQGRRQGELRTLAEDQRLFQNWDTDMRYAPTVDIQTEWIDRWKQSAEELIERMNFP